MPDNPYKSPELGSQQVLQPVLEPESDRPSFRRWVTRGAIFGIAMGFGVSVWVMRNIYIHEAEAIHGLDWIWFIVGCAYWIAIPVLFLGLFGAVGAAILYKLTR